MALPAAPPITLTQIYAEFGAPLGTPLTSMIRGGAHVPNTAPNASIPTAVPIDLLDFLGATNLACALSAHTVTGWQQSEINPSPPPGITWDFGTASFIINSSGQASGLGSNGDNGTGTNANYTGEWLMSGAASAFEVRATVTSGTVDGGSATGVYLNCGTTRSWEKAYAGVGSQTCTILVELRPAAGGAVMASATMTLTARRT